MELNNENSYNRAKERVECLKGFYSSLFAYCVIIPLLVYINYHSSSFPWALFPAVGWGIGLLSQWMHATGNHPFLGKHWEERKIREYMNDNRF